MNSSFPSVPERTIRCIFFDLGGTLWYRNKRDWPHLEAAANQRAGKLLRTVLSERSLPDDMADEALGGYLRRALNEQFRTQVRQAPHREPNGAYVLHQVLRAWGIAASDRRISTELFEVLCIPASASRILFDDTLSALAALQAHGFQLGVITNRLWGGPAFIEDMKTFGLLKYFDPEKLAISADLGLRKPAAEMYWHALRAYQVAPRQAMMVGDSLPADVVGAQQLGMCAVWKPKPKLIQLVKEHLGKHELSFEQYNADPTALQRSSARGQSAEPLPAGTFDTLLADILNHADYWHQFLQGTLQPNVIIERLSDLADLLVQVGMR